MAQRTKRPHTVPRVYLRAFATTGVRGQLKAYDRLKQAQLTVSVNDATVVGGMYDMPTNNEGIDRDAIEEHIGKKETLISKPFERIRTNSCVEDSDVPAILDFIALQIARTTNLSVAVDDLADWYAKVWYEGLDEEGARKRLMDAGMEPSEENVAAVLELSKNPQGWTAKPPKGSFLLMFLKTYLGLVPYVGRGRRWIVATSKRPLLTSDNPVVFIGDTTDRGLGVGNAEEIWLPISRDKALVGTRDPSVPDQVTLSKKHARLFTQRMALQATRWVYWHPDDAPLDGIFLSVPKPVAKTITVGWRQLPDGKLGELVSWRPYRTSIPGERLLNGRLVRDYAGPLAPEWSTRRPPKR